MPTGWLGWAWSGMFGSFGESAWHVQVTMFPLYGLSCSGAYYVFTFVLYSPVYNIEARGGPKLCLLSACALCLFPTDHLWR